MGKGKIKSMKVVLDTNVIISGLFWKGISGKILEDTLQGKYILCFSKSTLSELKQVLAYPKFQSAIKNLSFSVEDFLFVLIQKVIIVSKTPKINFIKSDPSDNKFLACAFSSQANFIVSGDKHLLELKTFQDIPILTPKQFVDLK